MGLLLTTSHHASVATSQLLSVMIPRKVRLVLTLTVLLFNFGSGSVLKDALEEHLKDISHKEGAESIKHDKQNGEKVHETASRVSDDHKNQYSKASDEAKYLKKDHDIKSSSDSDAYQGHTSKQDKAEDTHANGFKRGHKKGHQKQGFQNSYHKDESSNKSTFFDDFNDEGDEAAYKSRLNSHDNQGGRTYHGSHNNGQEYVRDNHHGGGYNRYADNGQKNVGHNDYGKRYYLDDQSNYNKYYDDRNRHDRGKIHDHHEYRAPTVHRDPGWDWQDERRGWERPGWDQDQGWNRDRGWNRDQGWERDPGWDRGRGWDQGQGWDRDYGGPGYYDSRGLRHDGGYGYGPNYGYGYGETRTAPVAAAEIPRNAPVVAHRKQTITIYEDPRYDGTGKGQLRKEEGDYLQLDFKPSSQRYASYDDTSYYNAPREGTESSKINRLVYNYRRH